MSTWAAAATWMADGNTSFDDCEALTSSLGWTGRPSRSHARRAMTSLAFMFELVPEPVWNTSTGNWSSCVAGHHLGGGGLDGGGDVGVDRPRASALAAAAAPLMRASAAISDRSSDRARHREVLDRPLGLRPPPGGGGHPHLAHRVVLDAELAVAGRRRRSAASPGPVARPRAVPRSGRWTAPTARGVTAAQRDRSMTARLRCRADDRVRVHRAAAARPRRDDLPPRVVRRRRQRSTAGGHRSSPSSPRCSPGSRPLAMHEIAHYLRPGSPRPAAQHPRRSRGVGQRPLRRPRPAEERLHLRRRRAAHVPGHRHRHREGQEGPVRVHRRAATRRPSPAASSTPTSTTTCATARWRRSPCGTRSTPRPTCPPRSRSRAVDGDAYKLLFMAKGGGSANKSYLFQETKALLNPQSLAAFLDEKLRALGTAACPPYHLAVVIGGTSAEFAVETAKLASTRYLDSLPTDGQRARARLPRRRARGRDPRPGAAVRHRRPVRRQVLLPRRAGHPAAAPRRLVPGRHRGVVLGRPPGPGQDHPRRRVPRAARARPGPVPARGRRRRRSAERRRAHRPRRAPWTRSAPS